MGLDVYLTIEVDTGGPEPHVADLYDANVTHNLGPMAKEAGIYEHLWRPDEIGIETASELIEPLMTALEKMKADPARFEELNPPNGYGSFLAFELWVEHYLEACRQHPKAKVVVWR